MIRFYAFMLVTICLGMVLGFMDAPMWTALAVGVVFGIIGSIGSQR